MSELSRHIEALLLYNDCVIVPGLGGFIAHHVPAQFSASQDMLLPPYREIGFNPRLHLNDGLLVQSFMEVYGTDFGEANNMVRRQVGQLITQLQENGKVELKSIGELRYNIHCQYTFTPYTHRMCCPVYYGLDSFTLPTLDSIQATERQIVADGIPTDANLKESEKHQEMSVPQTESTSSNVLEFAPKPALTSKAKIAPSTAKKPLVHINLKNIVRHASSVAAIIIVILSMFLFARPIENTGELKESQAMLSPTELFGMRSMTMTSVDIQPTPKAISKDITRSETINKDKNTIVNSNAEPFVSNGVQAESQAIENTSNSSVKATPSAKEVEKVTIEKAEVKPQTLDKNKKLYNIIVASVSSKEAAIKEAELLKSQGYANAKAIVGDGKSRVSIASYEVEAEAYQRINQFKAQGLFDQAWVLRK